MSNQNVTSSKKLTIIRVIYEPIPGVGGSIRHTVDLYMHIDPYIKMQYLINPVLKTGETDHSINGMNILRPYKKSKLLTRSLLKFIDLWMFAEKSIIYANLLQQQLRELTIVHVHGLLLGLYMVLLKKLIGVNMPIIIMVHGGYTKRDHKIGFSYNLQKLLMLMVHPDAYVLLNDGSDIDDMIGKIKKNIPYTVVYHAIDTNEFHKVICHKADRPFRILFPHRLVAVKSPEIALHVINELICRIMQDDKIEKPRLEFVFLAPSGYNNEIKKLQIEDYVIYAGFQTPEGMLSEYNKADVVIGTSLSSNMGRATQEAMACETTVVTFQSGHMETLIEDKVDGYLVQPGDVKGMSNILYWAYHNRKKLEETGKNARCKIMKERSWDKRVNTELGVYDEIVRANKNKGAIKP